MFPLLALLAMAIPNPAQAKPVDAYWSVETKIGLSGGVERSESRLYLFKGGTALRGFHHGGVDSLSLAKLGKATNDTNIGKWTTSGAKITIRWGGGTNPSTLTAKGANLEAGPLVWRPIKPVDGMKMAGHFAREDPKDDGAQLMLREDGTFAFRSAHKVNQIDLRPVAPNDGTGKYVLRNWTIYLKYDSGQTASMAFELPHTPKPAGEEFVAMAFQNFYKWPGEMKLPEVAKVETRNETIGDLVYSVPVPWRKEDRQPTATFLHPAGVEPGQLCLITLPRPEPSGEAGSALHRTFWAPITQGLDRVSGANDEMVGLFNRSWAVLNRPDGSRIWIALYTTSHNGKAVAAMFSANREEIFFKPFPLVETLMRSAKPPTFVNAVINLAPQFIKGQ